MLIYVLRRLLIMVPTLFGITIVGFVLINLAPGGPIEQKIQQVRFGGTSRGESGVSEEVIEALKKQYGFDKPIHVRYALWLKNIVTLDFGDSFNYEEPVVDVIAQRLPVSLTFGLVSLVLTYLICIPLGVLKAIRNGSHFDTASSVILFVMLAIPPVMLAVLLIVFCAGSSYLGWFPIGGLNSETYTDMSLWGKIWDRTYHAVLPLICYTIGNFTFLTFMMKNSMLDVLRLDFVRTAQAKGLPDFKVYMKHVFRNALIPIVTGLSSVMSVFFAGSIIIEQVFNIEGMGRLSLTAINTRDYNVLMGLIFLQSILFLAGRLLSDILYVVVDPRIDFA